MKDIMASLPEVINEYRGYNLLIPTATDVQLNPFYKFHAYLIRTRIRDGKFVPYQKMFVNMENYAIVNREELIGAMTRAKMCTDESVPAEFDIEGEEINVILQDKVTNYREKIMLKSPIEKPIRIGFDSRLVLETIKAFTCENITLNFSSPSTPMIVQAEDSDMKALVLPVRLKGATK